MKSHELHALLRIEMPKFCSSILLKSRHEWDLIPVLSMWFIFRKRGQCFHISLLKDSHRHINVFKILLSLIHIREYIAAHTQLQLQRCCCCCCQLLSLPTFFPSPHISESTVVPLCHLVHIISLYNSMGAIAHFCLFFLIVGGVTFYALSTHNL